MPTMTAEDKRDLWALLRAEYVDARAVCRMAGRRWEDYWRSEDAQAYASAVSRQRGIPFADLVRAGAGDDVWVHRAIGTHLAQWCSPQFAVWVSGFLAELMTTGQYQGRFE